MKHLTYYIHHVCVKCLKTLLFEKGLNNRKIKLVTTNLVATLARLSACLKNVNLSHLKSLMTWYEMIHP